MNSFKWIINPYLLYLTGVIAAVTAITLFITPNQAFAVYHQDDLIDNALFLDAKAMSASDIQNFLAGKSSYLATYSSYSNRDSSNVLASQIIYEAAQDYGINPQVILATLQKEQSLVTAQNPLSSQLNYAMGYGCPDNGTCSYPGFFNQVANGTWQLRLNYERANGNNSWWNSNISYSCSASSIFYSPGLYPGNNVSFIDSTSTVYATFVLANAATASLYCYTPHAYSTTSQPPYNGSYNFVISFENWFGPTTDSPLSFSVIQDPNSSALYLQTNTSSGSFKYYLPSHDIMKDWGIDTLPVNQVSLAYFNALATKDWVGHLLKDEWNNLFMVEAGTLHYIPSSDYAKLWGLDPTKAVQSLGVTYSLPSTTWSSRFVRDITQPTGQIWLMDGGSKRAVSDGNMLYEWGYTPNQLTTVSTNYLNGLPTANPVSQYVSDGTKSYLIDTNKKLAFSDSNIENDFGGGQTPDIYNPVTLSYFSSLTTWQFVVDSSTQAWYMLEGGKKHYITNGNIATLWGLSSTRPLTRVSHGFISSLTDGGNLSFIVQTQNPSMYWVIDNGTKRYISNANVSAAWTGGGTPPIYSSQSLASLTQGADITSVINGSGSSYIYILDGGTKRYLSNSSAVKAWTTGANISTVSNQLVWSLPEGSFISYTIKDSAGNSYLMMDGTAYPINSGSYDAWAIDASTPSVSTQTIARYPAGSTLSGFVTINGNPYLMANGKKMLVKKYADAYPTADLTGPTLSSSYFDSTPEATFLIGSTDPSDSRVWLMASGKKIQLSSFVQQVTYGYISKGVTPTLLSPSVLGSIPDSSQTFSQFIQSNGSGIKFVNFGYSLGFPDGDTLTNLVGANQITQVSPSVFNSFALMRSASRLIVDDHGNYYFMENGLKRPITSGAVLAQYKSYPVTYLEGVTMALIPNGAPL